MLIKGAIICIFLLNLFSLKSQISIGGGFNSVAVIDVKKPYLGLNLLGEFRNDDMAYFAKFYTTLPQSDSKSIISMEPIDMNEPLNLELNVLTKYRYNVLELGKKNYYGNDLDFGPAAYVSSHFSIIMNTLITQTEIYDETRYRFPTGYSEKAKIYAIAAGLNAGGQYAFFYGTYYIDFGLNYVIRALPTSSLSQSQFQNFNSFRQLFFIFNFGFKKNLFNDY